MTRSNSQLSEKDKNIIIISSFTAQGKLEELKASLNKGLDARLTINEIKEILVHTYAYCGFPRSIRGLQTFMEVLDERKAKGINDTVGKEASTIANDNSKYERGKEILAQLTQTPQPDKLSGYSAFAPTIDTFLKEHLFADIFERDLLAYAQRELVTISVISAIGNAEPMLQSHLGISLNVGWSPPQLNEFVPVISSTISIEKSNAAKMVLNQVLKNKSK
ncbi:carboxymuconolactone decarboxylase family protein [Chryseobacterium sp. JV274]|uniref:carboxymuconolactone decarboxylase family protein n=1 Tax=Chryseobacterium sp. JV274 TaxID=1932669 RepID=UPI001E2E9ADC|nr:carboxymuconolactone decarboxylase family protein [Chryseobacterium sp. JV274]